MLIDLDRLLADARTTGLTVEVTVEGQLDRLSPAVSREAYRIVQEGLTNVVRHANSAPVVLLVAADDTTLMISISNPVLDETAGSRGGGSGLEGMRARVGLLGGRFSAGREGSAWLVQVRLPTGKASAK